MFDKFLEFVFHRLPFVVLIVASSFGCLALLTNCTCNVFYDLVFALPAANLMTMSILA